MYEKEILETYLLLCIYGANNISVYICVPFIGEGGAQHGNGCFLLETSAKTSKRGANSVRNCSMYILNYTF